MKFGGILILALALFIHVESASVEPTITDAVAYCEREVPKYCISTTCPLFCNSLRTSRNKANCNSGCTANNRCAIRANAASTVRGNEALDAQNREQLIRCIAQTRDPNFTKTGMTREDTNWKNIRTPSFVKATRP